MTFHILIVSGISLITVLSVFLTQALAIAIGEPCDNAKRGQSFLKCEMHCNVNGNCAELISVEKCDCKGHAVYEIIQNNYLASTINIYKVKLYAVADIIDILLYIFHWI